MNKKKIELEMYRLLQKLKHTSRSGTKEGCVKIYHNNTYEHELGKFQLAYYLKKLGFKVFTECEFVSGGRADVVAISPEGEGIIYEVLCSETEERYLQKTLDYPSEFVMVKWRIGDDFNLI